MNNLSKCEFINKEFQPKIIGNYKYEMEIYLQRVASSTSPYFVLIFSGTTHIQEYRCNRPIRQTQALLKMNIPVFFSYWRWRKSEVIPYHNHKELFESPIDKTLEFLDEIIKYDFKNKKKIFIVSFPHKSIVGTIEKLKTYGWHTIYDARDNWEEFEKVGQAKWFDSNAEKYIVDNCDRVYAVSRNLQNKIQQYTNNKVVQLCTNALDDKFLNEGKVKIAPRDGKPLIGYVGHLTSSWFDWDSLLYIANSKPHWNFEIIGHSMPQGLKLPPNIKYLGPKKCLQIKEIAKRWRAAIIPFRMGELSDAVDPIKVYEYLAMGLPVVSFKMDQISDYPYVFIANNVKEFIGKIEKALLTPINGKYIQKFLYVNTWENKVKQFIQDI